MKKIFSGPFVRNNPMDKWHWMKGCPEYPLTEKPQAFMTSDLLDKDILCKKCLKLHKDAEKKK